MKKFAGDTILHMCTKNHNRMMYGSLRYGVRQAEFFCHSGQLFALLPPPIMILKIKIKKMPGDIILLYIHVYHKWRSYDIWFLKYKVWQTEIFCHFGPFFAFSARDNLENQNFKIEINTWRYYHFIHFYREQ